MTNRMYFKRLRQLKFKAYGINPLADLVWPKTLVIQLVVQSAYMEVLGRKNTFCPIVKAGPFCL